MAVGSAKGAPGATTLALLLAATWPRPVVVVEADPDGGTIGARLGERPEPGLSSLGAATRNTRHADPGAHCRPVAGLAVVLGPRSAERARAALTSGAHLAGALADAPADVVVDCGRFSPASPALPIAAAAALALCVSRPTLDQLQHVSSRVASLESLGTRARLVLVGDGPYSAHEVEETLDVPVAGVLPDDPAAAGAIWHGRLADAAVRRSRLVRAAADITRRLDEGLLSDTGSQA